MLALISLSSWVMRTCLMRVGLIDSSRASAHLNEERVEVRAEVRAEVRGGGG